MLKGEMAQDLKCDPQSIRDLRLVRLALAEFLQAQSPATQAIEVPTEVHNFFAKIGKQHGGLGGYKRAMNLTKEQRVQQARNAINARWAKKREQDKQVA